MSEVCEYHERMTEDLKLLRESVSILNDSVKTLQASVTVLNDTTIKSSEYYDRLASLELNQKKIISFKDGLYALCAMAGGFIGTLIAIVSIF